MSLKKDVIGAEVQIGTNQAQASLVKLAQETSTLTNENDRLRISQAKLKALGKEHKEEYDKVTKAISENNKTVKENKAQMDALRKTIGLTEMSQIQLKKRSLELRKELSGMTESVDPARFAKLNNELIATDRQFNKVKGSIGETKKQMNPLVEGAKGLLPAFGIAAIVGGLMRAGAELFNLTKQIQGESIRSTTVLGDEFGYVSEQADRLASKMGVTNREFISMVTNAADLLVPLDFSRKKAAEMATQVQSLSGALDEWTAGKYGVAEVSNILTKAMLGEMEQLKGLGIAIRMDSAEYKELVKQKQMDEGATLAQASAMATLELIYKKSSDAQMAYTMEGNELIRFQKSVTLWWKNMKEGVANYFLESAVDKLKAEQEQVNGLAVQLKSANLKEEEREAILIRLNQLAPELAKSITEETANIESLTEALSKYNDEMALKILIAEGDDDIAKQKTKVEAFKRLSIEAEAEMAKELKKSIDWFAKEGPSVKKQAEAILYDAQKSLIQKGEELNSLALKVTTLGNSTLFHALNSYNIFKEKYSTNLNDLNVLITKTNSTRDEWSKIFGTEQTGSDNGEQIIQAKSLLDVQNALLATAQKMPETTENEIAAKNKSIDTIEKEISRLKQLGVAKGDGEKTKKEAANKALIILDEANNERMAKLTIQYEKEGWSDGKFKSEQMAAELAYLIQKEALLEQFGQSTIQVEAQISQKRVEAQKTLNAILLEGDKELIKQLEDAAKADDKAIQETIKNAEKTTKSLEKSKDNEQKLLEDRQKNYLEFGQAAGETFAGLMLDNEATMADYLKATLLLALEALHQVLLIEEAKAIVKGIGGGIPGIAIAVAKVAAMELAYNAVKGLLTANSKQSGGFSNTGSDSEPDGIYHKNEFIASAPAVRNPTVKPILDIINLAQRNGTIATLNLPAIMGSGGRQSGGYASPAPSSSGSPIAINPSTNRDPELVRAIDRLNANLEKGIRSTINKYGTNGLDEGIKDITDFKSKVFKK